jgi:iron complex outermembrane recepter protein
MPGATRSRTIFALSASLLLTLLATTVHAQIRLDLPAQPLGQSLTAVGTLGHLNVMFDPSIVDGLQAPALKAELSADEALGRLLSGTKLHAVRVDANTIRVIAGVPVQKRAFGPATSTGGVYAPASVYLANAGTGPNSEPIEPKSDSSEPDSSIATSQSRKSEMLEEVVVTGTHLVGVVDSPSPIQTYTRDDIDRSGAGTIAAFLQTIPQNFTGGASETTIGGVAGGGQSSSNAISGAGVNLRGLGNDATVVLVNGHRIAPGNVFGDFVDISSIPLSAVDRIDIVTDGASAVYGSDAVGGVVNFILRKDFDGLETRGRFGSVSRGSSHESEIGQTIGKVWATGSALLSYEFYDKTPLSADSRSFSDTAPLPFTLLPEQVRHSAFISVDQSISDSASLFADGMYSHRSTYSDASVLGGFDNHSPANIGSGSGTVGARWKFSDKTEIEIGSSYAVSSTRSEVYELSSMRLTGDLQADSKILSVDPVLRGTMWETSNGPLLYAVGGQYRYESLDAENRLAQSGFAPNRRIVAGFAELRVPLVGPSAAPESCAARLELNLADREEHYSDFGSTNNPTYGLSWRPLKELRFRGTYGTSFVAPLLNDLNPTPVQVVGFNTDQLPGSAPPGSGPIDTLIVFGGNSSLTAQSAKTWTLGADWREHEASGVRLRATYYGTQFRSRITNLQAAGFSPYNALAQEAVFGPTVVQRNPAAAIVQTLISAPTFVNYGANLSNIGAIINSQFLNVARVDTSGIDFGASFRTQLSSASLETGLDSTYILKFDSRFTSSTPSAQVLNTPYNPTRIRARGRVVLTEGPITGSTFINYVSSYDDPVNAAPVASWTTVDLTASYGCRACAGALRGFVTTLAVLNIADRNPPYVANANGFAVNFDGANANALGRYYSLQLAKRW